MAEGDADKPDQRAGDKVRVRVGPYNGRRGTIEGEVEGLLEVELDSGEILHVSEETVTNYSRAARRAWLAMPKRAGRPAQLAKRKKMVSLRIEVDLWNQLERVADSGLIKSREEAVNNWLREGLQRLERHFAPTDRSDGEHDG
jgi:transposase